MQIFTKKLTYTDIDTFLAVPASSLWAMLFPEGHYKLNIPVKDDATGLEWSFRLSMLKFGSVLILSQFLSGDWLKFVKQKGLIIGDKVTVLYHATQYRITVERKIITSSGECWVDIEAADHHHHCAEADAGDLKKDGHYQQEFLPIIASSPASSSSNSGHAIENIDNHIDIEFSPLLLETMSEEDDFNHGRDHSRNSSNQKVIMERTFVIINFFLEVPSLAFDQLSSAQKAQYALAAMLISLLAVFICFAELIYRGKKERITWRWRSRLPWLYYPSPNDDLPFGSLMDVVGLGCAIPQLVLTTINYSFCRDHVDGPIKISLWPIMFALVLLCSKLW